MVITVGTPAVIVAVRVQQEEGRMGGVVAAGLHDAVMDLAEHVRVLQGAKAAAGILVTDIALGGDGDDLMEIAVRVLVAHVFRPQQARRNF